MNDTVFTIPNIRCDFILEGSSGHTAFIERTMQWKSIAPTGDWTLSTGDVLCGDTSLVTDIILNLLPEYSWAKLIQCKQTCQVSSVVNIFVYAEESCLPFIILNRELNRFLNDTGTKLRLFVREKGNLSEVSALRLKLFWKDGNAPFGIKENCADENAGLKPDKIELFIPKKSPADGVKIYQTKEFSISDLSGACRDFCIALSEKGLRNHIEPEKSIIELSVYRQNGDSGFSFEAVFPEELICFASELGVELAVGCIVKP